MKRLRDLLEEIRQCTFCRENAQGYPIPPTVNEMRDNWARIQALACEGIRLIDSEAEP